MPESKRPLPPQLQRRLRDVIDEMRRRRMVRGFAQFAFAVLILVGIATIVLYLAEPTRQTAELMFAFLIGVGVVCAWAFLWRPSRTRISLEQAALFIDEHHPELQDRIISAVEFSEHPSSQTSAWLQDALVRETEPLLRRTSLEKDLDPKTVARAAALAAIALGGLAAVLVLFGETWRPYFAFSDRPEQADTIRRLPFTVDPGDARVRVGDNQVVWVTADNPSAKIAIRYRFGDGDWLAATMGQSTEDTVFYHQFSDVQQDIQYQVSYGEMQSDTYQLTAWMPPEVDTVHLVYHFPEYLNQPDQEVPNSGNIVAVEGTEVEVRVAPNKKLQAATLLFDEAGEVALKEAADGHWTGRVTVDRDDRYEIALVDLEDAPSEYNPNYTVKMKRDQPPEISIEFPRGDSEVTMLDEIPFDFKVTDDFGFDEFGIQYEVAGEEPVRIALNTEDQSRLESAGHHELLLEDMEVAPGDFITWTVWARDGKPDRGEFEELGDPFFLEIRPFRRTYQESISGGGMGGQQGEQGGDPIMRQKNILIATWQLRRKIQYLVEEEFTDQRDTIAEEQRALQQEVSGAAGMMGAGAEMTELMTAMESAIGRLNASELPAPEDALSEATDHMQKAYRLLLKMRPTDSEVTRQQGGGGGGGGANEQRPDISSLELDRNRNFYEEESRTQRQQEAATETLNKLKELAQRQQLINEEIEKLISELQTADEEERKELQKRLERLREELEQNLERVDSLRQEVATNNLSNEQSHEAQRGLKNAREQMNQTLDQLNEEELQQARASSSRAMESLGNVQDFLKQLSRDGAAERLQRVAEEMKQLQERQKNIEEQTETLKERHESPSLEGQKEAEQMKDEILSEKEQLAQDFTELMENAADLAERSKESQELMSRDLNDWLRETAKEGIIEDLEETTFTRYGVWDTALRQEERLTQKFNRAAENLQEVAENLVQDDLEAMQKALQHLEELRQEQERQQQAQAGGQAGEQGERPGEDGEPGEQGLQPGEEGERRVAMNQEDPQGMRGPGQEPGDEEQQAGRPEESGEEPGEGMRPDPEGEQQAQQPAQTGQQGEQSQQGQPSQQGQQGQQQGQQPGQQQGQQGQQGGQGQQQGQQSPGQQSGEGQRPQIAQMPQLGQMPQPGQRGGQSGGSTGGNPWSGPAWTAGGPEWWTPDNLRRFVQQDYQQYLERLRNAEALLPADSPLREDLARVRENVEALRRDWRQRELTPQFDLFLEMVEQPLIETAARLQREIQRRLEEKEFILVDEGEVPERYRRQVAEYFKQLSESETATPAGAPN